MGGLDLAIGGAEAHAMRVKPHHYVVDGITVHGATRRGSWYPKGPVLVCWATDDLLSDVEGKRPVAVAAVPDWPDDVAGWLSTYESVRVGQVRTDQEAKYATEVVPSLDARAVAALDSAGAGVNNNHATLHVEERQRFTRAFRQLRTDGVPVERDALQQHLMAAGWSGRLIAQILDLGDKASAASRRRR